MVFLSQEAPDSNREELRNSYTFIFLFFLILVKDFFISSYSQHKNNSQEFIIFTWQWFFCPGKLQILIEKNLKIPTTLFFLILVKGFSISSYFQHKNQNQIWEKYVEVFIRKNRGENEIMIDHMQEWEIG